MQFKALETLRIRVFICKNPNRNDVNSACHLLLMAYASKLPYSLPNLDQRPTFYPCDYNVVKHLQEFLQGEVCFLCFVLFAGIAFPETPSSFSSQPLASIMLISFGLTQFLWPFLQCLKGQQWQHFQSAISSLTPSTFDSVLLLFISFLPLQFCWPISLAVTHFCNTTWIITWRQGGNTATHLAVCEDALLSLHQ